MVRPPPRGLEGEPGWLTHSSYDSPQYLRYQLSTHELLTWHLSRYHIDVLFVIVYSCGRCARATPSTKSRGEIGAGPGKDQAAVGCRGHGFHHPAEQGTDPRQRRVPATP